MNKFVEYYSFFSVFVGSTVCAGLGLYNSFMIWGTFDKTSESNMLNPISIYSWSIKAPEYFGTISHNKNNVSIILYTVKLFFYRDSEKY